MTYQEIVTGIAVAMATQASAGLDTIQPDEAVFTASMDIFDGAAFEDETAYDEACVRAATEYAMAREIPEKH